MVRVLTEQDDFYLLEWGRVKGVKDEAARRVDDPAAELFIFKKGYDLQEIGFCEFLFEVFFPAFFDLYIHSWPWFPVNDWAEGKFFLILAAK
jgi:hypothetical protein